MSTVGQGAGAVTDPLDRPLAGLVDPATVAKLEKKLELRTVGDLLRHYPRRYYERGELTDFASLRPGEHVTIRARIVHLAPPRQIRAKLSKTDMRVSDGRRELVLTFFNAPWVHRDHRVGQEMFFAGQVETFQGRPTLRNPEAEPADDETFAGGLVPVYPSSAKLAQKSIRRAVAAALERLGDLDDPLPREVRGEHGLLPLAEALRLVHAPTSRGDVTRARQRLRFDEAFLLQTLLALRRAAARALPATPRVAGGQGLLAAFDARLPFELTEGQRRVGEVLAADLAQPHPMHRLLQGEVGSGKTVVALRAMLTVVDAGGQAALLAPTEVLAQQHHRSITAMLGPLAERGLLGGAEQGTRVTLLTGSQPTAVRRRALLEAASGEAGIVVGTHALLEEKVQLADLGLVVVDEQHRFGVEQRDALRAKGTRPPHVLVMTATPIPRTVAMTVFGDLETSTLEELPRGRSPIETHVVPLAERPQFLERAWQRVREEVAKGHQAFVVCPRIGGDEEEGPPTGDDARRPAAAVLEVAPMLAEGPLQGLRVEVLHGRMPAEDKEASMGRFAAGAVDVLVATTVIEVGVDVPRASAMVVLDADRFGVSQLHQLRGRVGRGTAPGIALLVTEAPVGSPARERLEAVAATLDGFELSRVDLEQRREGDVLGAAQSGRRSSLRLLSVLRHEDVIRDAREAATRVVADDPALARHGALRLEVERLVAAEQVDYLGKA